MVPGVSSVLGDLDMWDPGWAGGGPRGRAVCVHIAESPCTASRSQHSVVKHLYFQLKKRR